jgi:GNAT superfamily N-acetyltransferase
MSDVPEDSGRLTAGSAPPGPPEAGTVTVSSARPEDIDALVASVIGLFAEDAGRNDPFMDTQWPVREGSSYYAGLVDDPACLLAVAWQDGEIVGHLVGKLVEPDSLRLVRFAVLESMRVRPERRGRGAGGLLIEEFFTWARRNQAEQASVTAFAANEGAQRLYARYGFRPASVTMRSGL